MVNREDSLTFHVRLFSINSKNFEIFDFSHFFDLQLQFIYVQLVDLHKFKLIAKKRLQKLEKKNKKEPEIRKYYPTNNETEH